MLHRTEDGARLGVAGTPELEDAERAGECGLNFRRVGARRGDDVGRSDADRTGHMPVGTYITRECLKAISGLVGRSRRRVGRSGASGANRR